MSDYSEMDAMLEMLNAIPTCDEIEVSDVFTEKVKGPGFKNNLLKLKDKDDKQFFILFKSIGLLFNPLTGSSEGYDEATGKRFRVGNTLPSQQLKLYMDRALESNTIKDKWVKETEVDLTQGEINDKRKLPFLLSRLEKIKIIDNPKRPDQPGLDVKNVNAGVLQYPAPAVKINAKQHIKNQFTSDKDKVNNIFFSAKFSPGIIADLYADEEHTKEEVERMIPDYVYAFKFEQSLKFAKYKALKDRLIADGKDENDAKYKEDKRAIYENSVFQEYASTPYCLGICMPIDENGQYVGEIPVEDLTVEDLESMIKIGPVTGYFKKAIRVLTGDNKENNISPDFYAFYVNPNGLPVKDALPAVKDISLTFPELEDANKKQLFIDKIRIAYLKFLKKSEIEKRDFFEEKVPVYKDTNLDDAGVQEMVYSWIREAYPLEDIIPYLNDVNIMGTLMKVADKIYTKEEVEKLNKLQLMISEGEHVGAEQVKQITGQEVKDQGLSESEIKKMIEHTSEEMNKNELDEDGKEIQDVKFEEVESGDYADIQRIDDINNGSF